MTQPLAKPDTFDTDAETPGPDMPPPAAERPGWFTRTYAERTPSGLADDYARAQRGTLEDVVMDLRKQEEAYEAYRRRLDERFAQAKRQADPASAERVADASRPMSAIPPRPYYGRSTVAPEAATKPSALRPVTLAILTLTACTVGGTGGYVAANPDSIGKLANTVTAYASSLRFLPVSSPTETVVVKKPVQTARLEVKDTAGAVNAPIPLDITALPINAETPVAVRISGLPDTAYLTKGVEVAEGEWVLKSTDIAKAELVVPRADQPVLALQVAALEEKTGMPAAPSQDMKVAIDLAALPVPGVPQPPARLPLPVAEVPVITPASAMPDQGFNKLALPAPIPQPLERLNPQAQNFIAKGNVLLESGDILAARQFYQKAFDLKATAAAYGMGQTYDPAVYAKQNIAGLTPDPAKAAEWYSKAAATGHEEAAAALALLPER